MKHRLFVLAVLGAIVFMSSCGNGNDDPNAEPANEFTSGSIASPDSTTIEAIQDPPQDSADLEKDKKVDTIRLIKKKRMN